MATRELYKDSQGKRVPSVTTILSRFKDSGGLLYWANQAGLDGMTLDEARMPAATAGTLAHDMVEADINKQPFPMRTNVNDSIFDDAAQAFDTYRVWRSQSAIKIKHTEVSLVSDRHKFGGRIDAIGEDAEGRTVLLDWKTSNAVYADYVLQMAGYAVLWHVNYPDRPITGGFHLCRFAKEKGDFSHHYFADLDEEIETFLAMRRLFDQVKAVEKRVK